MMRHAADPEWGNFILCMAIEIMDSAVTGPCPEAKRFHRHHISPYQPDERGDAGLSKRYWTSCWTAAAWNFAEARPHRFVEIEMSCARLPFNFCLSRSRVLLSCINTICCLGSRDMLSGGKPLILFLRPSHRSQGCRLPYFTRDCTAEPGHAHQLEPGRWWVLFDTELAWRNKVRRWRAAPARLPYSTLSTSVCLPLPCAPHPFHAS